MNEKEVLEKAYNRIVYDVTQSITDIHNRLDWLKESIPNGTKAFMRAKGELMDKMVRSVPIRNEHCPYCVLRDKGFLVDSPATCVKCNYGKEKGICTEDKTVYKTMLVARDRLLSAIKEYAQDCPPLATVEEEKKEKPRKLIALFHNAPGKWEVILEDHREQILHVDTLHFEALKGYYRGRGYAIQCSGDGSRDFREHYAFFGNPFPRSTAEKVFDLGRIIGSLNNPLR